MKGRVSLRVDKNRPLRHAIEIRNDSFDNPSFIALLRKHNVALVIAETARRWPMLNDVTADFMYLRLHGDKELYRWAKRIAEEIAHSKQIRNGAGVTRSNQSSGIQVLVPPRTGQPKRWFTCKKTRV